MKPVDDINLIKQAGNGDQNAFASIVSSYNRQVFALISRMVQSREDAEELTQDVFVKIYHSLKQYKGECMLSTWIYRIAYNTSISSLRKKKLEIAPIDEYIVTNVSENEVDDFFARTSNDSQLLEQLERAIERLNAEDKLFITLFYMESHSIEEISLITGYTSTNIKTKLHRIRKKLYDIMIHLNGGN